MKKKNFLRKAFGFFWKKLRPINRKLLFPAVGYFYGIFCWLLMKTVRMKAIGKEKEEKVLNEGKNFIYGFWDGKQIMLFPFAMRKEIVTTSSLSDAGETLFYTHRFFAISSVRGSSTRGGTMALKGIIRKVKKGKNSAIAVDGPRGPYQKAKMGIIEIAKMTGAVILPLTASVKNKIVLKQYWNKVQIPLPLTRGVYILGDPILVERNADRKKMDYLLELFERELKEITKLADEYC